MRSIITQFDKRIISLIALLPESWRQFFILVTSLGDPIITLGIGGAIIATGLYMNNMRLAVSGVVVWTTLIIGSIIKLLVSRARPLTEYAANLRVDTYSFPSGHSSGSMIAYGLLAYLSWYVLPPPLAIIVTLLCVVIIFGVGVSRVYLGAHFPSDVLAGWILGLTALGIIIIFVKPLQ